MSGKDTRPPSTDQEQALRQCAEEVARERASSSPKDVEAMSPEEVKRMLHELRVHQIELEMQNEELRRTQEANCTLRGRVTSTSMTWRRWAIASSPNRA